MTYEIVKNGASAYHIVTSIEGRVNGMRRQNCKSTFMRARPCSSRAIFPTAEERLSTT